MNSVITAKDSSQSRDRVFDKVEIMQLIRNMQNKVNAQIKELDKKFSDKKIYVAEYTPLRDILDAKIDVLLEVEDALRNDETK